VASQISVSHASSTETSAPAAPIRVLTQPGVKQMTYTEEGAASASFTDSAISAALEME
jgi:hypothetical protein